MQVRSVSRTEARFGSRQGVHVQSQPETEPAEGHRQRRHRRGSPEHHQRRPRLLPVYGQLQREVKTHTIHNVTCPSVSKWVAKRTLVASHCSLCVVQIKALAKIHAFVVDPWVTFCVLVYEQTLVLYVPSAVQPWLMAFMFTADWMTFVSPEPSWRQSKQTSERSVWNCGGWVEKLGCIESIWNGNKTELMEGLLNEAFSFCAVPLTGPGHGQGHSGLLRPKV